MYLTAQLCNARDRNYMCMPKEGKKRKKKIER